MEALSSSPLVTALWLAGIGAVVLLLHLLEPRPLQRVVASTALWEVVARRQRALRRPWRAALSLLLALAIALALAAAVAQPEWPGLGFAARRVVVVADNAPSMAARMADGRTRWQHATAAARTLIESAGGEVMLLDTMGRAASDGFVERERALASLTVLASLGVPGHGEATMPAWPVQPGIEAHLVTDGVAIATVPPEVRVHRIFEPADNVAVTGFETRPLPADPSRAEAFVQVTNASSGPKRVRVTLRGGERFKLVQDLTIAPGEVTDLVFDLGGFEGGLLAASAIARDDALERDDIAYTHVPPRGPRQILLVTEGNGRLRDSLESLPGVKVATQRPAGYREPASADVIVFDRFAPERPPAHPALLLGPRPEPWLPGRWREARDPVVREWDPGSPLTEGVAWNALRMRRATLLQPGADGAQAIVRTRDGGLVATGRSAARWIVAGFSPQESNLPLQPGFPVFLGNAVQWLGEDAPLVNSGLGPVRVPLEGARVTDGYGRELPARSAGGGTEFEAAQPGLYTATNGTATVRVAANSNDPRDAAINASRLEPTTAGFRPAAARLARAPWMLLAGAALVLLLADWLLFARRPRPARS